MESYGLIGTFNNKIVAIQRKNSLEYIQIVVGKYNSFEVLKTFIYAITLEEFDLLSKNKNNFHYLWKKLWGTKRVSYTFKQKQKFEHNMRLVYFENFRPFIRNKNTEFLLPKGRLYKKESPVECAIREFHEETGIKKENIRIQNRLPIKLSYIGSDSKKYINYFYFASIIKWDYRDLLNFDRNEISQVSLLTKEEALSKINRKRKVLRGALFDLI